MQRLYWLADGFHRDLAAIHARLRKIDVVVWQGDQRDAILHSVGANAAHGLRRTNEDKRRAVATLLMDEEWSRWSDRKIAERCHVPPPFVGDLRAEFGSGNEFQTDEPRTFERGGKVHAMKVRRINAGRRGEAKVDAGGDATVATAESELTPNRPEQTRAQPEIDIKAASAVFEMMFGGDVVTRADIEADPDAALGRQREQIAAMFEAWPEERNGAFIFMLESLVMELTPRCPRMIAQRDAPIPEKPEPGAPSTAKLPRGVRLDPKTGKYLARKMINGVRKELGYFATPEEAGEAYEKAGGKPVAELTESRD